MSTNEGNLENEEDLINEYGLKNEVDLKHKGGLKNDSNPGSRLDTEITASCQHNPHTTTSTNIWHEC